MKICITAQGNTLDSQMELRFGRSPYFIIYDTETLEFEAIKNPNIEAANGVGIKSAQLMSDKNVQVLLTGKIGPKAADVLNTANIQVINSSAETVQEAITNYQA
ncbi:MAG: NifB/NifX family molybdenum-iron cluster-binding protein [Gammaproteobacteria bacterium]|nr:NifB/NifX family molybdenum-iron cluster-binding protein [Gammaproteobacteria bacterium]